MIFFSRHLAAPDELALVKQALETGHGSGDGACTARASELLSELHGGAPVLLTTSCTHALELAALVLGLTAVALPAVTPSCADDEAEDDGAEANQSAPTASSTIESVTAYGARPAARPWWSLVWKYPAGISLSITPLPACSADWPDS